MHLLLLIPLLLLMRRTQPLPSPPISRWQRLRWCWHQHRPLLRRSHRRWWCKLPNQPLLLLLHQHLPPQPSSTVRPTAHPRRLIKSPTSPRHAKPAVHHAHAVPTLPRPASHWCLSKPPRALPRPPTCRQVWRKSSHSDAARHAPGVNGWLPMTRSKSSKPKRNQRRRHSREV